jgi:hypothetical protein
MRRKIELALLFFLLKPAFKITQRLAMAYGRRLPRDLDERGIDKKTRAKFGATENGQLRS